MCQSNRRQFLVGCSAAIASMAGSRFGQLAFADPGSTNQEILIIVFARGGLDGLNLVPPIAGADRGYYETARPNLQVPVAGPGAALSLDGQFGLHPAATSLFDLYQNGNLAIVQATGLNEVNRSHFDAMEYTELGTPGTKSTPDGWLTRHLATASNLPPDPTMGSLAVGGLQPTSLRASYDTVNLAYPDAFNIDYGPWLWLDEQKQAMANLFGNAATPVHVGGVSALNAMQIVEENVSDNYTPANGAVYPETQFGEHLKTLAQLVKLELGLQVATVDIGGWDTHENQGQGSGGYFADIVTDLSTSLSNFYLDLDGVGANNWTNRMTIIVHSEFGRELRENSDEGTEHGYANQMLLLGGNVIGGLHGSWPTLHPDALTDGTDLAVTTDYRRVFSEVLIRRMCNADIPTIFPGYQGYEPLGVVQGADLPLPGIFSDGFESGDTFAWSSTA